MQFSNLFLLASTAITAVTATNFTSTSVYVQAVVSPVSALSSVSTDSESSGSQTTDTASSSSGSSSGSSPDEEAAASAASAAASASAASAAAEAAAGSDGKPALSTVGDAPSFSSTTVIVSHETTELITITSCSENVCTKIPTSTTYFASSSYNTIVPIEGSSSSSVFEQSESSSEIQPSVTINENAATNVVAGTFSVVNVGAAALSVVAFVFLL